MKRLTSLFMLLLVAGSLLAQDGGDSGGDGLFGDGGLFGGGAERGGGNRGQAQGRDRLAALRNMLVKANSPLSKEQERALNAVLDKEIRSMTDAFQQKFGVPPSAAVGAPRGGRGGTNAGSGIAGSAAPAAATENPMVAEIRRMNNALLGKIILNLEPDQQAVMEKFQKDEIRARGGIEALKLILQDAGAPSLSPEQSRDIETLYAEQIQARAQLRSETQSPPDPKKGRQLEMTIMAKITRILTPEQRKALLDSMKQ